VNVTVRVAEIDAPEKAQPWGNRRKQHVAARCFGKPAIVARRTTDRYGRTVARVECDGIDASAEQIRAGMAWVFDRYVTDRGLYAVQDEARDKHRGCRARCGHFRPGKGVYRRQGEPSPNGFGGLTSKATPSLRRSSASSKDF
jgi:endonuclease YncB( thermonuclease family)